MSIIEEEIESIIEKEIDVGLNNFTFKCYYNNYNGRVIGLLGRVIGLTGRLFGGQFSWRFGQNRIRRCPSCDYPQLPRRLESVVLKC